MTEIQHTQNSPAREPLSVLFESGPTFLAVAAKEEAGGVLTVREQIDGVVAGMNTIAALSVLAALTWNAVLQELSAPPANSIYYVRGN